MRNQDVSVPFVLVPLVIVLFAVYIMYSSFLVKKEGFEDGSGAEIVAQPPATPAKEGFSENPVIEGVREVGELVLGQPYDEIASAEKPGEEFHLDAGGSFLSAYKKLQPEQIASMTKDTRELIETQKQLMSTLATLKPLISDGKEMLKTFSDYFGTDMKGLSI